MLRTQHHLSGTGKIGRGSLPLRCLSRTARSNRGPKNSQDSAMPCHLSGRNEPPYRYGDRSSHDASSHPPTRPRQDASSPDGRPYPTRIPVRFKGKSSQIVLDQMRTVDKNRLVKRLGKIDEAARACTSPSRRTLRSITTSSSVTVSCRALPRLVGARHQAIQGEADEKYLPASGPSWQWNAPVFSPVTVLAPLNPCRFSEQGSR